MDKIRAKQEVVRLCDYFRTNANSFSGPGVKEAQIRLALIDPLLQALGWDVKNDKLIAPQYREVVPEKNLEVQGIQRSPDYAFRVGTLTRFYVEAKKCTADLRNDSNHAFQLRRYGWSGKTPMSVLTNFKELAVYDCTKKPEQKDRASVGRLKYFTFDEYADRWDEIWQVFSREAVWSGSFDAYLDGKRRRGTAEVDNEFLRDLDAWRAALARNMAQRNADLDVDDLNAVVQQTIDRIVFLRMAEDRGLEPPEQLLALSSKKDAYKRFIDLCKRADDKYNSGLFHFQKEPGTTEPHDTISPRIKLDDKPLRSILESLYFEHGSPYDFSVIPVEILGTVYERFLGKVISLDRGHRAKITDNPRLRRKGGVYYTPAYVVNYIVEESVAKHIAGKSPKQLQGKTPDRAFRVLDMACGSGSFLLGAFRCLLDHHLDWYSKNSPSRHKKQVIRHPHTSEWQLTIEEKKRILTSHIFGVDIDRQAVEVTKLSLLLKALEGESDLTLSQQLKLFGERALPNLSENIRCGNSLIESNYFDNSEITLEASREINPFDWLAAFPFLARRGWDCIIGNPPYVQIENIPEGDRAYFKDKYALKGSLGKRYDLYQIFILKAIRLLDNGGMLGFITPNTYLTGHSYVTLRTELINTMSVEQIVDLPQGVFEGVTVDVVLTFLTRTQDETRRHKSAVKVHKLFPRSLKARLSRRDWDDSFIIPHSVLMSTDGKVINLQANPSDTKHLASIERSTVPLGEIMESGQGIILYRDEESAATAKHTGTLAKPGWKKLLRGTNIGRYKTMWDGEFVHYGPWLWRAREEKFFARDKILLQAMRNKSLKRRLVATLDRDKYYNAHNLANIISLGDSEYALEYVLGLVNSSLLNYWYKCHFPNVNINPSDFTQLPIRRIDFADPTSKARHDGIVKVVNQLLALNSQLPQFKSSQQAETAKRQIESLDQRLDALVFELYEVKPACIEAATQATFGSSEQLLAAA